GMGQGLFANSPTFAAVIRRCAAALAPHVDWDLVACITGEAGPAWMTRVDMLQPALWATSVALAELWREAGVEPDVVVGHSQGEIAAATVAGILSCEDAARVVARRSQIVRRKSGHGLMLAVDLDVAGARAALAGFESRISLAANNGPTSCVLSGDADAVTTLQELLEADDIFCRLVQVDFASHSHHMDELAEDLCAALDGIAPRPAATALMSTVCVEPLAGTEMDASYWVRNLRAPVRFADAMARLFEDGVTHAVEISPHPVLVPAIEQLVAARRAPVSVLATLHRNAGAPRDFALATAHAFVAGLAPFQHLDRAAAVKLPAYPWQRKKYWVAPRKRRGARNPELALALLPAPGEPDAWQGGLELGLDHPPWLADHKVHDAVVVPGAVMLALALDAARVRTGSLPRALVDVRFHNPLALGDEPVPASIAWRDDVAGGGSFTLGSLPAGAAAWTPHATARTHGGARVHDAAFPHELQAAPATCGEAFYAGCAARGLCYGPAFRGVVHVFVDGDRALGEVRLPAACRAGARPHGLHPALWDAALQVCLALCPGDHTVVPTAVARVAILVDLAQPVTALWSHVVRRDA
ncbi:MAG TPA: acyltransferase domain-containing protein, partial [Kofleriaceae bacterium]